MSFSNPAPFASLLAIADSIKRSVEALQKHPEGAKAFEAWMDEVDFDERYGTRYKDLPTDHDVPEAMVLVTDSFGLDEDGTLYVEAGYSTYLWRGGEWVDEADDDLEEDDQYIEEHNGPESGEEDGPE